MVSESHDVGSFVVEPLITNLISLIGIPSLWVIALVHKLRHIVTLALSCIFETSELILFGFPGIMPFLLLGFIRLSDLTHDDVASVEGLDIHHVEGVNLRRHANIENLVVLHK